MKTRFEQKPAKDARSFVHNAEAHAKGLISFAHKNAVFARHLAQAIASIPGQKEYFAPHDDPNALDEKILAPKDLTDAIYRAQWLSKKLSEERFPGSTEATALLSNWMKDDPAESPKLLVVGVIVVAIPGITMGKFHRRKSMAVVIREETLKRSGSFVGKNISKATGGVLLKEVRFAGGALDKLEPDTADWFFGDRETEIYTASGEVLEEMEKEFRKVRIIHEKIQEDGRPIMIALSPSVNMETASSRWPLDPADD